MTRYYAYDAEGFYVGAFSADAPRPSSTAVAPEIRHSAARWNGMTWILDTTREQELVTQEADERNRRQQAVAILKSFNATTATANETRAAVAALIVVVRDIVHDLKA